MFVKEFPKDVDDDMGGCQIRYTTHLGECHQCRFDVKRKEHGAFLVDTCGVEKPALQLIEIGGDTLRAHTRFLREFCGWVCRRLNDIEINFRRTNIIW